MGWMRATDKNKRMSVKSNEISRRAPRSSIPFDHGFVIPYTAETQEQTKVVVQRIFL